MLLWYIGPANGVRELDFMGVTTPASLHRAFVFLIATLILAGFAVWDRARQLRIGGAK